MVVGVSKIASGVRSWACQPVGLVLHARPEGRVVSAVVASVGPHGARGLVPLAVAGQRRAPRAVGRTRIQERYILNLCPLGSTGSPRNIPD